MMKLILILACVWGLNNIGYSQHALTIVYDLYTGEITQTDKNGKSITKRIGKNNESVKVVVKNLNKIDYTIKVEEDEVNYKFEKIENVGSLVAKPIPSDVAKESTTPISEGMVIDTTDFGFEDFIIDFLDDYFIEKEVMQNLEAEIIELLMLPTQLQVYERQLADMRKGQSFDHAKFLGYINKLKSYIEDENLILKYRNLEKSTQRLFSNLSKKIEKANEVLKEIESSAETEENKKQWSTEKNWIDKFRTENLEFIEVELKNIEQKDTKDIVELKAKLDSWSAYHEEDFTFVYTTTSRGDVLKLNLSILKIGEEASDISSKKFASISVLNSGGFVVNGSVGINFSRFIDNKSFALSDKTIVEDAWDAVIPYLTTSILFYKRTASTVAVGGNFGLGFPISGSDNVDNGLTFFLGPSLIFGKQQRVVLNLGMSLGRIKRLKQGFEIGDRYDAGDGTAPPTSSKYGLGYFVGVSYNI